MTGFVEELMQIVRLEAPDLPDRTVHRIAERVHQVHGGTEPYIAKRPSVKVKAVKLGEAMQSRQPLAKCFEAAGVSRRTGYRLLLLR